MINPLITINVKLVPNTGKPSGYQFHYSSESGLVEPDGNINLKYFEKENVDLLFVLQPIGAVQPSFPVNAKRDAVWFASWPVGAPPPQPCPKAPAQANSAFGNFKRPSANKLKFTDKNNDKKRYTYALRCIVVPGDPPVVDDPVIINKISSTA